MRFNKKSYIVAAAIIALVGFLLFGPPMRKSIDVNFRVVDANSMPIQGAELHSHERHRHRLIPIPFFGPTWWSETGSQVAITNADGRATVSYRRDRLELDRIVVSGVQVSSFAAELALQGGSSHVTLNDISERYGIQANSPKPYEQNYVIRVR
jgi:hypothetical protein